MNCGMLNETRSVSLTWRSEAKPAKAEMARKGRSTRKIWRQPHIVTIRPPTEGPTAGAVAVISVAMPIISPIFSNGACSITMLNMSGNASPVPIPCTTRPAMSRENTGATAHRTVPEVKQQMATANRVLLRKRRFRNDESGMIAVSTSR